MPRQHVIIFIFAMFCVSSLFYLAIPTNLSFVEHNERATTIRHGEISHAKIPITWSDQGHILLPVSVNGTADLIFALDTGAPFTVVFGHEGTDAVPLILGRNFAVGGNGVGEPAEGKLVESIEIGIGPITIEGLKGVWLDWQNVPFFLSESQASLDGIIGYDLFSRFIIELNTTSNFLRFHDSWETVSDFSGNSIPIRIKKRKPYGKVEVIIDDNMPMPIVRETQIDTGSIDHLELVIPSDYAAKFPKLPENLIPNLGTGFQGDVEGRIGRVDQLMFGEYNFADMLVEFVKIHGGASEGDAQLGMGILSRFNLIFDYRGKQLFVIEHPDSFAEFNLDMSGLTLARRGERTIVSEVMPGTSADKNNFRIGDTITQIEGIPSPNVGEARALLRSGDGKKISVCRQTKKGEKCKTLLLKSRI